MFFFVVFLTLFGLDIVFPLRPLLLGQLGSSALFGVAFDLSVALPQEEDQRHCEVVVRSPQELRHSRCRQGRQPGAGLHVFQGQTANCAFDFACFSFVCSFLTSANAIGKLAFAPNWKE